MENAELIGLSRQAVLRRHLDVIANNLANMNTTGFKGEKFLFQEFLMPRAEASGFRSQDRDLSYVQEGQPFNDFTSGAVRSTGNPLDLAIDGDAWFVVNAAGQERYTRAGAFTLDQTGTLTTMDGNPVLGDGGPITFRADESNISVAADGTVSSSAGGKGRLRLVHFDNNDSLQREGSTLFSGANALPADRTVRITQGAVEQSNVRSVVEITRLVEVTRAYTSLAKVMAEADQLNADAIDQLGKLNA